MNIALVILGGQIKYIFRGGGGKFYKILTFEPLNGFSNFKSLNALKFCQEFKKNYQKIDFLP